MGLPPTERKERTGLLTPPGKSCWAALRTTALSIAGDRIAKSELEVRLAHLVAGLVECGPSDLAVDWGGLGGFFLPDRSLAAERDENAAGLRAGDVACCNPSLIRDLTAVEVVRRQLGIGPQRSPVAAHVAKRPANDLASLMAEVLRV